MCGICGVVQRGGEPRRLLEPGVLDAMTDLLRHRGPNDRGTHEAPGIALGARRLSIVDLAGGHQPLANEDGSVWAAQNGELYEHATIRERLESRGHRFVSRCDTEVIPHVYEEEGDAFPARLRGKFAIAVWDARRRRAVLARDRFGIKPLYYAVRGDLVVFASELKSVLASGLVDPALDLEAIDVYLTLGYFPGEATPLAGVRKLPAAHRLVVEADGVRVERYWELPVPHESPRTLRDEEWLERLLAGLEESVRLRLMSDVPLGAMLSGGLDSSVVTALMARNMSAPVKTFSVGFREDPDSELADARVVAAAVGADHHELELSLADEAVPLEELVWHLDEPLADLSALGFHALSRLAASHVTVALSGQGADELLGGYSVHRNAALADRVPTPLRRAAAAVGARGPGRLRRAAEVLGPADPAVRYLRQYRRLDPDLRARLYGGALRNVPAEGAEAAVRRFLPPRSAGALATSLYLSQQLGLVDDMLHYFDRCSMASSLEVRVPFLDHELVELCAGMPERLKVDARFRRKALLRRVGLGLLPERIVEKPKVGFFSAAVPAWFRAQLEGPAGEALLRPDARIGELVDLRVVGELARDQAAGRRVLLPLLMLEVWLSSYLPRALAAAPRPPAVPV